MHGKRIFPRESLVDAHRLAGFVDEEIAGCRGPAERPGRQRRIRLDIVRTAWRLRRRRHRARIRRLVTEAAGPVDRAEQRHQHGERANRLKAVGMRGKSPHGVKSDGVPRDAFVLRAPRVRPRNRQRDLVVARRLRHLAREAADRIRCYPCDLLRPFGRRFLEALPQQREGRGNRRAVGQHIASVERGLRAGRVMLHCLAGLLVPPQVVLREERIALGERGILHEQAERVALRSHVQQFARVGVALDELVVVRVRLNQFVDQRHEQRAVRTGANGHPFVGDGRVAGADRVDRDEAAARALELRQGDLERIGVVVLRRADHDEEFRAVEVRSAELPERAADRVDHAGRHVRGAKAAVSGVVGGAELLREEARQRLHLVAAREERELFGVGCPEMREALFDRLEGHVPRNGLELRFAAFRAALAHERLREARRGILLHDPRRTLRADHPLVQRVFRVAVDIADFPVSQMHANAATARAHVAGRGLDFQLFVLCSGAVVHLRPPFTSDRCPGMAGARHLYARNGRPISLTTQLCILDISHREFR